MDGSKNWWEMLESWIGAVVGVIVITALITTHLSNMADLYRIDVDALEKSIVSSTNNQVMAIKMNQQSTNRLTRTIYTNTGEHILGGKVVVVKDTSSDKKPMISRQEMMIEHHRTTSGEICSIGISLRAKQAISYDSITQQLGSTTGACSSINVSERAGILWQQLNSKS